MKTLLLTVVALGTGVASAVTFPARGEDVDCSSELSAAIAAAPEGGEIVLAAGRHRLAKVVWIDGKRQLTLRGETGATIVVQANATGTVNECNNAFHVRNCEEFRLENLTFTTDSPVNASGCIVATDPARGTFDIELSGDGVISGGEHVACLDTCDDRGLRDGVFELNGRLFNEGPSGGAPVYRVGGVTFEKAGPRTMRFVAPGGKDFDFSRIRMPHRVAIRYSLWGGGLLTFDAVRGALVRDVRIVRCNAMAFVINPGSSDFRFERLKIGEASDTGYSSNADGIHVVGLSGRLELSDCRFYGLGDDALNVHSRAGIVSAWDGTSCRLMVASRSYDGRSVPLSANWAKAGDALDVYDARTFLKKGTVRLSDWTGGVCTLEKTDVRLAAGDVVANARYSPAVRITGSTCERLRARAFLLQTSDVIVDGCSFRDVTHPALLFAPDIDRWFEMAPSHGVKITRSTFENCGARAESGAIAFRTSHSGEAVVRPAGVHTDVEISSNRFVRCGKASVCLTSVSSAELKENLFEACGRLSAVSCEHVRSHCR